LSRPRGDAARARFQATVAALGEPARSTFEAAEAETLLARTGWPLAAENGAGQQTTAGSDRLRTAGLLVASPGPPAPAPAPEPSQSSQPSQPSQRHDGALPLSALLCQALVAYTIEFDNEAERRLPHRTTSHGASGPGDGAPAPWL